tara:strand:- start:5160 stop:5435 length:276 start_codon:yes stop_codon:yes gene_type:complete
MANEYKFVCTEGEGKGAEYEVMRHDLPAIGRFLRLQLEWELHSADQILNEHWNTDRALHDEFSAARFEMLGRGIFQNKWQARSTWALVECL